MTGSVNVSRKFMADFEAVASNYRLKELGQYDEAKQAARDDLESAIVCFAALAKELS